MLELPDHGQAPTLAELQAALDAAGEEDARWEAKGAGVDVNGICKAVAGLANHEGGVLVLGVDQEPGGWTISGMAPRTDGEPGRAAGSRA